ncbi:MAG: hypothetical protein IKV87_07185, partial [Methanobrevibacter sp.]|nr:hypothetical protein [Methanobrevibacter sp.]
NLAKLRKIRSTLRKLSKLSSSKIKMLHLACGMKPNLKDFDYIVDIVKFSMENKDFDSLYECFINNDFSSESKKIKSNLSNFEMEELCSFLDINPKLNFSKKGQLVLELYDKISDSLSNEYINNSEFLFCADEINELSKRVFVKV